MPNNSRKFETLLMAPLSALALLGACTAQQIADSKTSIDNKVASSQATVSMLCWGVQAADAVFKTTYAAGPNADPAIVADESKAVATVAPICANPPANLAQAVADLAGAYKAVQGATPAAVAAPIATTAS